MKLEMKVTPDIGLNVRTGPAITYRKLSAMVCGTVVIATKSENGWYYHDHGGWSSGDYLQLIRDLDPPTNPVQASTAVNTPPVIPPLTADEQDMLNSMFNDVYTATDEINDMNFIYGMPHQFTESTDPRPDKSQYGGTFLNTVIQDIPLLVVTPGKAAFLKNAGGKAFKNGVKDALVQGIRNEENNIDALLEGKDYGRYYGFESNYGEYIDYVNNMCRIASLYLGIQTETPYGYSQQYKNFNWHMFKGDGKYKKSHILNFLAEEPSVGFFIDAKQSSYGESGSNSTESSLLENAISKGGDSIKEFRFLMNSAVDDSGIIDASKTNYETAVKKVLDKFNLSKLPLVDQIKDYGTTIVAGANIALPEVWKDSSYGKNYSVEIKLVSPYGDKESIYWNILVPLFHLVALAFPRQLGRNGYMHPFLVRAFCKGWFNCSLGIVDSINIKKASQDGWSIDGLPTEIDVSLNIKDLYESMSMSRSADMSGFSNIEYMDFLATMTGVNINKPDVVRKASMYAMWARNKFGDFGANFANGISETVGNILRSYMQ